MFNVMYEYNRAQRQMRARPHFQNIDFKSKFVQMAFVTNCLCVCLFSAHTILIPSSLRVFVVPLKYMYNSRRNKSTKPSHRAPFVNRFNSIEVFGSFLYLSRSLSRLSI